MKLYRQKPVKGGRQALGSSVLKEIRAEVTRIAREYQVSRSFVVATVLADAFGVRRQERYYNTTKRRKRKK